MTYNRNFYNDNFYNSKRDEPKRKLYHKEVYMPKGLQEEAWKLTSEHYGLSFHLQQHLASPDSKHDIDLSLLYDALKKIREEHILPFEVETTEDGKITKFVIRTEYDEYDDISIVFGYIDKNNRMNPIIKTAWLNPWDDTHRTLDKGKYESKD